MVFFHQSKDHKEWLATRSIRCMDVKRVISLLRLSRSLSSQDVSTLYRGFLQNIVTDEQIIEASPWEVDTGRNVETEVLFPASQNIYCASVTLNDTCPIIVSLLSAIVTRRLILRGLWTIPPSSSCKTGYRRLF